LQGESSPFHSTLGFSCSTAGGSAACTTTTSSDAASTTADSPKANTLAKNPAKPKKVELWIPAEIGQLITGIILSDGTIVFPNGTPEGMLGYKLGKRIENQNELSLRIFIKCLFYLGSHLKELSIRNDLECQTIYELD
jgi:hypothetical protein